MYGIEPIMMLQILNVVAPVFILAAVGWVWVKRGVPYDTGFVSRMALEVGTPCLVFATLYKTEIDPAAFRDIALACLTLYLLVGAVGAALFLTMGMPLRTWLSPFIFSNSGNIGLPLCLFAFGEAGLVYGIVIFSVMVIVNFTIGVWIVSGKAAPWHALKQPMVYAALLGSLFALKGWSVPVWLSNTLELAGQITIPLMLITLGVSIARLPVETPWRAAAVSVIKLAVSRSLRMGGGAGLRAGGGCGGGFHPAGGDARAGDGLSAGGAV